MNIVVAAIALFLATVMPGMDASAKPPDSVLTMTMAAMDGMDCPDSDTSRDEMVGCMQAACIGFAVITDGEYFETSAMPPAYDIIAVAWPDDFKSAPSTPPI